METMRLEKNKVVLVGGSHYDHAIRVLGVKYTRVRTVEELEEAINTKTALVYMGSTRAAGGVAAVAKVTKARKVPLLVDAAADRLTIPYVVLASGADVEGYSGGKVICGPPRGVG